MLRAQLTKVEEKALRDANDAEFRLLTMKNRAVYAETRVETIQKRYRKTQAELEKLRYYPQSSWSKR